MASLADIRARLTEQAKAASATSNTTDNAIYAHWNIPEGSSAVLRFLNDGDDTNNFFWRERQMVKLDFPGVTGQDEHRAVSVQVPCIEMWGDTCPIHAEIRPWFKDPSLETLGRKYWKKRSYIFQGFVVSNPMEEDRVPENPIRRFVISPQIFTLIKQSLMDPEFTELPTDSELGTDFRVSKTSKGGYADYSTSGWARKERSLNQIERDAIADHGLFKLNDFMPKRPNADELAAIVEMFHASVAGEMYDPARWSRFYRPAGIAVVDKTAGKTAPPDITQTIPVAPVAVVRPSTEEILATIRRGGAVV